MDENLMNLHNAHHDAQRAQMENLIREGICPFCPDNLEVHHREPIERKGAHWAVTKNDYPYEGSVCHYLLIHQAHVTRVEDVSPEAFAELQEHLAWIAQQFPGGTFLMRSGDTRMTGATISHLHAHFVVGGPAKPDGEKIKTSIGHKI